MIIKRSFIYNLFIEISLILLVLNDLFNVEALSYIDEIIGVICLAGVLLSLCFCKKKCGENKFLLIALLLFLIIGFCGNIKSSIQVNMEYILQAGYIFLKQYIIFIFLLITLNKSNANNLYVFLNRLSKIIINMIGFFAIVNLFINIGLTGISGEFAFFANFGGTVASWISLLLGIILTNKKNNRIYYYFLSTFIIIMSNSGLGILGMVLIIMLYLFLEKSKSFKEYYILIALPIILLVSQQEIEQYLLDDTAPRALFFIYSLVTANIYFPFGAGFGTYASPLAAKDYSSLYLLYDFDKIYGMGEDDSMFLMDSYYPIILGELGYLGFFTYIIFAYVLLKKYIWNIQNKQIRCYTCYIYIFILVAGLGFGTLSSWGCATYIVISILLNVKLTNEKMR